MLSCFAGHQINLSNIQSRPTKEGLGNYYFYVEAEEASENLEPAVKCLQTYADVKILGEYSRVE
jgi:prephenate dehydratase